MDPHTAHGIERAAWLRAGAGGLLLLAVTVLPAALAQRLLMPPGNVWATGMASAGLVILLVLASRLGRWRGWPWLAAVLLACGLAIHLLLYGIARFSGIGFGQELFLHLEPESVLVAWLQYPFLLTLGAALLVAFVPLSARFLRSLPAAAAAGRRGALAAAILVLLAGLTAGRHALPAWQLAHATQQWFFPPSIGDLSADRVAAWERSGLVHTRLPSKHEIRARAAAEPRNLILLYLESGSLALTQSERWPDLMPNLARLQQTHGFAPGLFTSGFITIEGIVNSQCGTLYPFDRGSDSLAEGSNLGEDFTCLGDVLAKAGYRQVYLGGADLGFAGKGRFLASHGYDEQWGQRRWAEIGLHQRPGTWGVSDPDLFEQAFLKLQELREAGQPFNLTLLTIGTHLPGFSYAECDGHTGDLPEFVAAVACTDFLLGRFVERLEAEGQLDDTLLVITADHPVFPSSDMRELFGDSLIADRRLPLVVVGAGARPLTVRHGAAYDLAPTVLDLLGVEHNAWFALGRSLVEDPAPRDYFLTRYGDFHRARYEPPSGSCKDNATAVAVPLDACEHRELIGLLHAQVRELSQAAVRLACKSPAPLRLLLPAEQSTPLQLNIEGQGQAARFVHASRPVAPDRPGWWRIEFDADGEILARSWLPAGAALNSAEAPEASPGQMLQLQIWRSDPAEPGKPLWLPAGTRETGAWLMDASGRVIDTAREHGDAPGDLLLELDNTGCNRLLPAA